MTTFQYQGIAYRQGRNPKLNPWIVAIVVPAEELLRWAGIPRRSEHNFTGFQRAFDDARVARAKGFFEQPENQSPTALVVGLHPQGATDVTEVQIEFLDDNEKAIVRNCRLTVAYDEETTLEMAVERIKRQIKYRLAAPPSSPAVDGSAAQPDASSATPSNGVDAIPDDDVAEEGEPDDELDDDVDGDAEDVTEKDIELGKSILHDLLGRLDDHEWCEAGDHPSALKDMAKPATIIDGQHRVLGAQGCERNIPFAVCALYDCVWPEQVFQFTVVNYTAKGIPDQFITANAALSLTSTELEGLQTRLVQAGVKVIEYELMKVVHFDNRSPFYQLVNLSEKSDPSKIGYRTMVRIAQGWYSARDLCFEKILPNIYPHLRARKQKSARLDLWKRGDWGDFFIDFWRIMQDHYKNAPSHQSGHTLWEVGHSHLIVAVVLLELQQQFFRNLNAQDEEFFDVSQASDPVKEMRAKLEKRAKRFVEWLPADFFGCEWGLTSLSIGPGRVALRDALARMVDTNGKYQFSKSALVTGKTDQ